MTEPYEIYDLNPVDRITTGTVGEPGERVFYIQARRGSQVVTVTCEKEHVAGLAMAIDQTLLSLADDDADAVPEPDAAIHGGMDLEFPLNIVFRAGRVNLGYDETSERMVVIIYELQDEDDESPPSAARFWATPAQMRALSIRGQAVVAAGRPLCAMCGEPIGPEGHFCPRKNGNRQ
jgi:uncharacterized repeat protein (TIGR03847 family)